MHFKRHYQKVLDVDYLSFFFLIFFPLFFFFWQRGKLSRHRVSQALPLRVRGAARNAQECQKPVIQGSRGCVREEHGIRVPSVSGLYDPEGAAVCSPPVCLLPFHLRQQPHFALNLFPAKCFFFGGASGLLL